MVAVDCGSLRQAAELLRSQQSTLSRLVSQIEHHLGLTMFERSSGGVTPTAAGRSILRLARTIQKNLTRLQQRQSLFKTARPVGWPSGSVTAGNLKASLLDFKQRFPRIEAATVERRGHGSQRRFAMACLTFSSSREACRCWTVN
ncbi:LysR family transcriptional regulator [Bradyrhizobium sp. LMTR 3]|uniref:LysR family transcriptional regulator n=1 Tax=Bradyrhizobium sp. LMTR 3 TaxID=189873 RepID=UPI0032E3AE0B